MTDITDLDDYRQTLEKSGLELPSSTENEEGESEKPSKPQRPTQAELLIELASGVELFHTSDHECFATIKIEDHTETWPIRSKSFRSFLIRAFYERVKKPPSNQALQEGIQFLEAKAQFDGAQEEVFIRVAGDKERIYLDLANEEWSAVEITADEWRIVSKPDVKFRRTPGMLTLPDPVSGGSLEELRPLINAKEDEIFVLDVAWLVGSLKPSGPYPVDITFGEQGSAKSTRQRLKRQLIDPIKAPLRSAPRTDRDLMIAAKNGWIISLDNLSYLPNWLSDALCRLATGGGFSTRQLYTNDEEEIFESCRPISLNAIENMVRRSDLVDRALLSDIPAIPKDERKTEEEILTEFCRLHPRILGALLDAVSMVLRNYESVKLKYLPRMADFAKWVVAAEPALPWEEGKFLEVYGQNRSDAIETTLEADRLASAVREFMDDKESWEGQPSKLLDLLERVVDERTKNSKSWPGSANWLTQKLKRAATFLRSIGIDIEFPDQGKRGKERKITITRKNKQNSDDSVDTDSYSTNSK